MSEDRAARAGPGGPPPPVPRTERLDPSSFRLPVQRMRRGHFSDAYFLRARDALLAEGHDPVVTLQVFQKKDAVLCGMDEALAILRLCLTEGYRWEDLSVLALHDGDRIRPREPVLHITGPYAAFAHLETLILGVLARGTTVATNTRLVVEAAWPRTIMFFPARHDHWRVQNSDGYAAFVAGATGVSTDAQASWWGGRGFGTVPHALIAAYGGDTVAATRAAARHMPPGTRMITLVDFHNDSVGTALEVARAMHDDLHGVRLDTSESLVDKTVREELGEAGPRGVNPLLVRRVRDALDREGFQHVQIVVSGGFTEDKIRRFEAEDVPVDAYGVGSSLLRERHEFTADVVRLEGEPMAKAGRSYQENPRLQRVT